MTDFFSECLTRMSSAFNQPRAKNEDIEIKLTDDKTLKWRGLHNNQFAAAKRKGKLVKSEEEDGGNGSSNQEQNEALEEQEEDPTAGEESESEEKNISGTKMESVEDGDGGRLRVEASQMLNDDESPKNETESGGAAVCTVVSPQTTEPSIETTPEKKLGRRGKLQVNKSERVLRRNRGGTPVPSLNESFEKLEATDKEATPTAKISPLAKKSNKSDAEEKPSPKRKRSKVAEDEQVVEQQEEEVTEKPRKGRRKKEETETVTEPAVEKVESPEDEKPNELDTIIKTEVNSSAPSSPKSLKLEELETASEKAAAAAKKRGRKPKLKDEPIKTAIKKSQRVTKDSGSVLATAIARKEKINEQIVPPQRLSRRIKPTAKILANEELRYGFVLQNNARLSLGNETPDHTLSAATAIDESETKREKKTPTPPPAQVPPYISSQFTTDASQEKTPVKEISDKPGVKKCPDPEQFLHEIKAQKIALNRSPEDKKLNKKQQRRLFKLKEKHLASLGLQKTSKHDQNDDASSAESSDNEEFVPNRKIQVVAKPGVTLRQRSKQEEIPSKLPSSPLRKRKVNSHPIIPSPSISVSPKATPTNATTSTSSPSTRTTSSSSSASPHPVTNHHPNHHSKEQLVVTSSSIVTAPAILPPPSPPLVAPQFLCLCDKKSQYYVRKSQNLMQCVAVDQIEQHHIGCTNDVQGELLNLMRPSSRVSYMILCESHRKRLMAHNCCAGCGVFCSQGKFAACSRNHLFHRDCANKIIVTSKFDPMDPCSNPGPMLAFQCPHCGLDAFKDDFRITVKCRDTFVLLPQQLKRAKMVFPSDNPKANGSTIAAATTTTTNNNTTSSTKSSKLPPPKVSFIDVEKLIPESIFEILDKIESNVVDTTDPQSNARFTTRDLFFAIHSDNIERVATIIASGFDITTTFRDFQNGSCLHLVASLGSPTMAYLLLSKTHWKHFLDLMDNELRTAVMCAVAAERHEILKILLRCGADVSVKGTDGMTALHIAAKRGDLASTKIILDNCWQSWDITRFRLFINSLDDGNWTSLVWAAEHGYSDIVSYLISLGADANICDSENNTSLHWAALSDRIDTVLPLLQSNCDFNIQNINGDTPLHISCRQSNTQISLVFLAHGSDLNIKNILNETPYESIPDEMSQCARAIRFNIQLRELVGFPKRKVLTQDLSNGRERYPIQMVLNVQDNETEDDEHRIDLPDFKYITKTILLQNSLQIDQRVSQMRICSCSDDCATDECQCSISSLQNWYNSEGQLKEDFNFEDPAMIFECNDVCGCNKLLCKNRVVQNGIKCRLQVVECTDSAKGWGVQTLAKIKKGSYVAEYTGEILTDAEADRRTDDSYFFDLGSVDNCIDANFYGNVSRFFNHSCNPNIVPVRVYFEHQDLRFPKIAFFASRDIEPGEEIAFDYGEKFWVVKFKKFTCHCNAAQCKYSKTTISKTLEEYNQRINPSCVN